MSSWNCNTCGKAGHLSRDCPTSQRAGGGQRGRGAPRDRGSLYGGSGGGGRGGGGQVARSTSSNVCFNCQGSGHFANECPRPRQGQNQSARGQGGVQGGQRDGKGGQPAVTTNDGSQPSHYLYPVDTVKIDDKAALAAIRDYAKKLVVTNEATTIDAAAVQNKMNDDGLRTDFADTTSGSMIATNYLLLKTQPPRKIFVYCVEMIGELKATADKHVHIKNRVDRRATWDMVLQRRELATLSQTTPLSNVNWVTDTDLIWSTVELFTDQPKDASGDFVPIQYNQAFRPRNEKEEPFDVRQVNITFKKALDLSTPVRERFLGAEDRSQRDSDNAILLRGLNAFVTQYARLQNTTISVGSNKFFKHGNGAPLDVWKRQQTTKYNFPYDRDESVPLYPLQRALSGFSASVRPGIDHLFVNINPATSPFLEPILVSDYLIRLSQNTAIENQKGILSPLSSQDKNEVEALLRGVKVRITIAEARPLNRSSNGKIRFITGFGKAIKEQRVPPSMHSAGAMNVGQYYRKPWFPNQAVQPLDDGTVAVNVSSSRNADEAEWYPASCLRIVEWQPVRGRLTKWQTANMIFKALRKPTENAWNILENGLSMFGFKGLEGETMLEGFNLEVGQKLLKFKAAQIPPPKIDYGNNDHAAVRFASWNLRSQRFVEPSKINGIPILDFSGCNRGADGEKEDLAGFLGALRRALFKHGLDRADKGSDPDPRPNPAEDSKYHNDPEPPPIRTEIKVHRFTYTDEPSLEVSLVKEFEKWKTIFKDNPVLIILPSKSQDIYALVKRVAELRVGLKTICVTKQNVYFMVDKAEGRSAQYCSNLVLKYNIKSATDCHRLDANAFCKLRAVPNDVKSCNTIVIGADVAHPTKGCSPGCPSIAGVVGSVDDHFMQFPGSMRLQRSRQEGIVELGDMVKERLIDWAEKHGHLLPVNMLFYRDGVSESQYDQIRENEIPQLQNAFNQAKAYLDKKNGGATTKASAAPKASPWAKASAPAKAKLSGNELAAELEQLTLVEDSDTTGAANTSKPDVPFKLTLLVVGKRHNTRFYPTKPNDTFSQGTKLNGNLKPGLLVDRVITSPYSCDFYLQSHQALAGTARSAHYFTLTNQMALAPAALHAITHAFCYTYAKATRGVSYCAPAYYADRLCDRGRAYLRHWLLGRLKDENHYRIRSRHRDETAQHYDDAVRDHVYDSAYWRPHRGLPHKYDEERKNPWHEDLDGVMFYL